MAPRGQHTWFSSWVCGSGSLPAPVLRFGCPLILALLLNKLLEGRSCCSLCYDCFPTAASRGLNVWEAASWCLLVWRTYYCWVIWEPWSQPQRCPAPLDRRTMRSPRQTKTCRNGSEGRGDTQVRVQKMWILSSGA